jgi:hypothetical protein
MSEQESNKEERILDAVKLTLTNVIKDTATQPGMKHPLSDKTIEDLRHCLILITDRQQELAKLAGREMNMRPRYVDEPVTSGTAEVPVSILKKKK